MKEGFRERLIARLQRFVAFYAVVPFVFGFSSLLLYIYFAFWGEYDSSELALQFLFFGMVGCVTKGLHSMTTRAASRLASILLATIYLLGAFGLYETVISTWEWTTLRSREDVLGVGLLIVLLVLNVLAAVVHLAVKKWR